MPTVRIGAVAAGCALALVFAACASSPNVVIRTATPSPQPTAAPTPPLPPPVLAQSTPTAAPTAPLFLYARRCVAADLRLARGVTISPATQQRPTTLTLTDVSPSGCHLDGYPGIALDDSAGRRIPFVIARTGDQMVTSAKPTWVDLAPGQTAYVLINNEECNGAVFGATASSLTLIPPDDVHTLAMQLAGGIPLQYCSAGDPGSTIHVSPVEATLDRTTSSG